MIKNNDFEKITLYQHSEYRRNIITLSKDKKQAENSGCRCYNLGLYLK